MPPRKKTPVTFDQWLGHVIDNEARARGGRAAIGAWVGFFRDTHTAVLCDALLEAFPGARAFEHVGVRRRGGIHSTGDFTH